MEKALFAAGCFWSVEEYFRKIPGVKYTKVGYSGGNTDNPSYESVCKGDTNHAEVLLIDYYENEISYEKLIEYFWNCHDPTTLNRQGYDFGTQYRSAVFYYSDYQKRIANFSKNKHQKNLKAKIVTEITKAKKFYLAENYHQCYIQKIKKTS